MRNTLAVAKKYGRSPKIMETIITIFNAAEVPLDYTFVNMRKHIFEQRNSTNITACH